MKAVGNFRTFDVDENGNDIYASDHVCDICKKQSEVYIAIGGEKKDNGKKWSFFLQGDILICKTCLDKGQQLWNKAFLDDARKGRC